MVSFNASQEPANQDPLIDGVSLISGYAVRAFRRHLFLAALCFVSTLALTVALLAVMPPTYKVETRILAKPSDIMSRLAATGTVVPGLPEPAPTVGAAEIVKSRETLTWLVSQLDLVDRWQKSRSRFGRFLDRMSARLGAPRDAQTLERSIVDLLRDRVTAGVDGDTVTIAVEWSDPQGAVLIANALQARFLDRLKQAEVGQIKATVSLLEDREARARTGLAQATKELQDAANEANSMTARMFKLNRPNVDPDLELVARLQAELDKKREALRRSETAYDTRVAEAQADLNRLRATLGPAHPDVLDAQRNVALQSRVSPELATLRADEERLSSQLTHLVPQLTAAQLFERMAYTTTVDAGLETARERFRQASESHADVSRRLEASRVELASAEASFPYRYQVTQPPVAPRGPAKPNVPVVLLAGILAAAVLSFVIAVLADVFSGRIQEPWQIVRYVGLPVLSEVRSGSGS